MGEALTALDATFLELEEADQSAHMHIGGVILIEGRGRGGAPPISAVREDVGARLPDLPRFRERLSEPATGGLRWPRWEPDSDFDVGRHVFAAGLPRPGGRAQLLEWAGEFFSQRLDRTRPLWELAVVELADGRWALVSKTHHCLVDGVGSVDIGKVLLDAQPRADARPPAPATPDEAAGAAAPGGLLLAPARAATAAVSALVGAGRSILRATAGAAAHPSRIAHALTRSRALAELVVRDELIAAPRTSLNRPIGAKRRLLVVETELGEVREIKRSLGGTVNDVVLAAAAGGLRRLLLHRGEEPPQRGLRAMVPMNVREAGDRLAVGNRITSLFVHLPVAASEPIERYLQQLDEAESLKAGTQAEGSSTLLDLAGHMPPVLHSFVARSLFATRLFNVTITNIPGPQDPLYCFGARVREIWPLVPIAAEHAVGLAVFSYDGRLFFCLNLDRDSCEDGEVLGEGISASLRELQQLAAEAAPG